MRTDQPLRHGAAALAVVLGVGLLGASVGDMARMDGDLRAATLPSQRIESNLVVLPSPRPRCDEPAPPWRSREV